MTRLAEQAGRALRAARLRVATAESCTGGSLATALTDVPGSSNWFERGYVTYSNEAKIQDLGVDHQVLAQHGAVSAAVVEQMAAGALRASGADLALAVSGVAGPDGGTPEKPVGLVYFALQRRGGQAQVSQGHFPGDRAAVRGAAVHRALQLITAAALVGPGAHESGSSGKI
ncbi:MAG TPA: nicotinamide-nucleotide amidohydrolase family protein [Steroidobacteraceae bacterium]|jgi:nicotinamide-nucleotide amidase|nr:nicotinamide-nucleotide amidohydrolase family protein [Steroidobacteraceae bacterium]